jgi:hypothetical protein
MAAWTKMFLAAWMFLLRTCERASREEFRDAIVPAFPAAPRAISIKPLMVNCRCEQLARAAEEMRRADAGAEWFNVWAAILSRSNCG